LPVFFPFQGMVMQEESPVILFDVFGAGQVGAFEVVLNEFEMDRRGDVSGVRFGFRSIHNSSDR
jgi:hypothetical protein